MSSESVFASTPAPKSFSIMHGVVVRQVRFAIFFALLPVVPLCSMAWGQTEDSTPADQKVKKVFYSAKDRLQAMHDASLFTAKSIAGASILEGPAQNKKQFQLHFNDKVICDFSAPGSQMGGKTPKFSCKITRVEGADGAVQTLT